MAENKLPPIEQEVNAKVKGTGDVDALKDSIENLGKAGKRLPGPLGDVADAAEGLMKGFQSLGKAAISFTSIPIIAVITGIALAITSVIAAFKNSEAGQNKFAKIMATIGAVTQKVVDVFADFGNLIIDAFTKPKESLEGFMKWLHLYAIDPVMSLWHLLTGLGDAISDIFHGNLKKAAEDAKKGIDGVSDAFGKANDGVNKAIDSVTAWGKSIGEASQRAQKAADLRAKADAKEREDSSKKLKLEASIAELREKMADKETYSAAQRKDFAEKAKKQNEELYSSEEELLKLRNEAAHMEYENGAKTKEAKDKLLESDNALLQLQIDRAKGAKTLEKALITVDKEENAAAKQKYKEQQAQIKEHTKQIQELDKEERKANQKSVEDTLDAVGKKEQALNDAYEDQVGKLDDLLAEGKITQAEYSKYDEAAYKSMMDQRAKIEEQAKKDKEKKDAEQATKDIKTKEDGLKDQEKVELDAANLKATDKLKIEADFLKKAHDLALTDASLTADQKLKIDQDYQAAIQKNTLDTIAAEKAAKQQAIASDLKDAQDTQTSIQNLSDLAFTLKNSNLKAGSKAAEDAARKEFAVNKSLQLAGAIVNGANAITSSLAQSPIAIGPVPNPAGIASLAMAITSTAASIAKIASTTFQSTSTAGGTGIATGGGISTALTNTLNGVGNNSTVFQNPLNGQNITTGGSSNNSGGQPIQAFIVNSDITRSQNKSAIIQRRRNFS